MRVFMFEVPRHVYKMINDITLMFVLILMSLRARSVPMLC